MAHIRKPSPISFKYTPDGPEFKPTMEGLEAARTLYEKLYRSEFSGDKDEEIAKFNVHYGDRAFSRYDDMRAAERTLEKASVRLETTESDKGYIISKTGAPIGSFHSGQVTVDDLIKSAYPGLTDREKTVIQDGDYSIASYVNGPTIVANSKTNSFCMTNDSQVIQVIPHDAYVGPFLTLKSAGFRHPDGKVDRMEPNAPKDVKKYLKLLQKTPDVNPIYAPVDMKKSTDIATYFATKDELKCATDILEYIDKVLKEHPEARDDHGITGHIIRQLQLNETDYMAIAKLIQTHDKYDDIKLLHGIQVYNDDYSAKITDKAELERIQDAFGKIRECYYGENSMTKTLELELGMASIVHDTKKEREDAMDIIDSADDNSLSGQMSIG